MNSKILIICGDPNSINSEIIFKAWKQIPKLQKERVILIGNFQLLFDQAKKLRIKVPLRFVEKSKYGFSIEVVIATCPAK